MMFLFYENESKKYECNRGEHEVTASEEQSTPLGLYLFFVLSRYDKSFFLLYSVDYPTINSKGERINANGYLKVLAEARFSSKTSSKLICFLTKR